MSVRIFIRSAAPLRALSGYWLAAIYGLKWFMNFTQLYGIPWRHAECEKTEENVVKTALASIGANGYIVTRPGVKINMVDAKTGGGDLPQKVLIDLADQQCDQFILGQTLTSGTDNSGSRALGEVHKGTLDDVVAGVADFVGEIITHQLIPAIVAVNYGERDDMPEFWAKPEETKDEKGAAERMKILTDMGIPMSEAYVYEDLGVPIPAAGDKLFESAKPEPPPIDPNSPPKLGPDGKPLPPQPGKPPIPPIKPPAKPPEVKAADRDSPEVTDLFEKMERAIQSGTLVDEDAIASILAGAWIIGAKEKPEEV